MLHEHEPGAWDFARELTDRGIPLDAIPLRGGRRPDRVPARSAPTSRGTRPRILHTHLVHADVYGQLAGRADAACRCASRRSTASTSSARTAASRSATGRSRPSRTRISRSRAGSRAISRRSRASTARASRSSTTGSSPTASRSRTPASAPRLLCVGRLIPIKGHIVLLRAFAEARRRIARRSSSRSPAAGRWSRRCGRSRGARHRGRGPLPRLRRADPDARSRTPRSSSCRRMGEGFGMVALEAMERARPVIAAEIGGLGELVRDGVTGLLVPPGEAEPLVERDRPAGRRPASSRGRWAKRAAAGRSSISCRTAARTGRSSSTKAHWLPNLTRSGTVPGTCLAGTRPNVRLDIPRETLSGARLR